MTEERSERLERLVKVALELEPAERAAFLSKAYAKESSLREQLDSLVSAHEDALATATKGTRDSEAESPTQVRSDSDLSERAVSEQSRRHIGRYRIVREIGRGGMGLVYEAEQQEPRRSVAVKVIRGEQYLDEHHVRLFQREGQALARLKHPGIAGIYEAGCTEDGHHFFAMELVAGEPLSTYLSKRPTDVPWKHELRSRLELFTKICEAVNYAHQRGVIHRDLKPSNIIVTTDAVTSPRSASPQIKILDFGLARITDPEAGDVSSMTAMGRIQGTLPYMSPEQARGNPADIDSRSDIYSLGVLLYETVTGERPYEVDPSAPLEAIRVICEQEPKRLSAHSMAPLDPDVETILLTALEKDPSDRYQSALALADDIHRYLANRPILAHPPSTMYQLKKLVYRHKMAFGFVTTLFLLVLGFAVVTTVQSARIAVERDRAERRRAQAEDLIGFMLGDLRAKLEPVGQLEILDDVGDKAIDYFASVPPEDLTQEELFRQAQAFELIGTVRMSQGRLEASAQAFEMYRDIAVSLASKDPANPEWALTIGYAEFWVGDVLRKQGNLDGAFEHYENYLEIAERLYAQDAKNRKFTLERGYAHYNVGLILEAKGDLEAALAEYEITLATEQELVRYDSDVDVKLDLARSHDRIGVLNEKLGRLERARQHYKDNLDILVELVDLEPDNATWLNYKGIAHNHLAQILQILGQPEMTVREYRKDLVVREQLTARDPMNTDWARELAVTRFHLGLALLETGERNEAMNLIRGSVTGLEALVDADPSNRDWEAQLVWSQMAMGRVLLASGENREALERATTVISTIQPVTKREPALQRPFRLLADAYLLQGRAFLASGRREAAAASWKRGVEVIEPMARDNDDTRFIAILAELLIYLEDSRAESEIQALVKRGYRKRDFIELCKSKGLDVRDLAVLHPPASK